MWNSTCLIGVSTIVDLIDDVEPMPNCTVTCPLVVLLRVMPLVRYKAWNCPYPAVEYFKAPVSITTP
jgi:hypothetical protein